MILLKSSKGCLYGLRLYPRNLTGNSVRELNEESRIFFRSKLDNPNKVYINSSGGTGSIAGVNQNLALSQGYKKLFQYLQQVEDFRDSAYREPTKDELYSVGFGHRLTPDELEDFKNGKTINKELYNNFLILLLKVAQKRLMANCQNNYQF